MEYIKILPTQVKDFMYETSNLHDSVISKINYISGSYATERGTYPFDDNSSVVVTLEGCWFQEKFVNIELLFENVEIGVIKPATKDYDSIIYEAGLAYENGKFTFVTDIDDLTNIDKAFSIYIIAKKLSYRVADIIKH